jgi:hypothetical protein
LESYYTKEKKLLLWFPSALAMVEQYGILQNKLSETIAGCGGEQ